jgi:hypothetical protein
MTSGAQRLRMSVRRSWTWLFRRSSWFPGAEVEGVGMVLGAAVSDNALLGC